MKYPFGKPVFNSKIIFNIKSILSSEKLVHGKYMDKFEENLKNLLWQTMQFQFLHVQLVCNFLSK